VGPDAHAEDADVDPLTDQVDVIGLCSRRREVESYFGP
jgi:hypothetical protein